MKIHELKCWIEPFYAVVSGKKTFEFRENDRDYEVGDVLILREWDPATETLCEGLAVRRVTYLLEGPAFGVPDGYVVMSLGLVQ